MGAGVPESSYTTFSHPPAPALPKDVAEEADRGSSANRARCSAIVASRVVKAGKFGPLGVIEAAAIANYCIAAVSSGSGCSIAGGVLIRLAPGRKSEVGIAGSGAAAFKRLPCRG